MESARGAVLDDPGVYGRIENSPPDLANAVRNAVDGFLLRGIGLNDDSGILRSDQLWELDHPQADGAKRDAFPERLNAARHPLIVQLT